ncbi:MAG TPA: hypothetical protein VJ246_03175 [Patescibacteria group bacterium]|nr:hypothetical protein [Patescibacteria group bacterium]
MGRIFLFFVSACFVTLLVAGGVYAWKNQDALKGKISLKNDDSQTGEVLGEAQEKVSNVQESVQRVAGPIMNQVAQIVNQSASMLPQGSLSQPGSINVNDAVEQVKQQAASIPEKVFQDARYEYCRQVVQDYEKKR